MPPTRSARLSRRELCALCGGAIVGASAGCLGDGDGSVSVLSAGSLATTFEASVGPAFEAETGIEVRGEYYGTNALIRMVEDGTKRPDVVVSADTALLRDRLYGDGTDWDLEFASNCLGVAYDEGTAFGRALEDGEPWYELVRESADELAISDPDLDPLGYRAIQAFELAEREHGLEGFREAVLEDVYVEPEEPQLLAGVDSGSRAGAIAYENMAIDHGIAFEPFRDAYNFANPDLADHYASAEFTTDDGYTVEGRPIVYSATVLETADDPDAGRELVDYLAVAGDRLEDVGLLVPDALPRPHGSAPEGIEA